MKNMFDEEVKPRELSFRWLCPHLEVLVDGHFKGIVSPNGWQGSSCNVHHPIGAPIMSNMHLWFEMSLQEMTIIIDEWNRQMSPERSMELVVAAIAKNKKISFDEAVK